MYDIVMKSHSWKSNLHQIVIPTERLHVVRFSEPKLRALTKTPLDGHCEGIVHAVNCRSIGMYNRESAPCVNVGLQFLDFAGTVVGKTRYIVDDVFRDDDDANTFLCNTGVISYGKTKIVSLLVQILIVLAIFDTHIPANAIQLIVEFDW